MEPSVDHPQIEPSALWRILDITRQLSAASDLNTLLTVIIDTARAVLNADRGTIFLYDADSDELFIKVATGVEEIRFPANKGIAGQCAKSRDVINVPDCYADDRFNREIDKQTGYKTRCLLSVPLIGVDDELVGVLQMVNKLDGIFEDADENLSWTLAAQSGAVLQRARLVEEYLIKQKLERDLALARDIQMRVLPSKMPTLDGYDLAGWSRPADETGGDIYDAVTDPDGRVQILLGDATGHGIGPALSVTQVRAMFRMTVRLHATLDDSIIQINDQLADDLADDRFVTVFIGAVDHTDHKIKYHAGGQGPLLHFKAESGETDWFGASTVPLGIMSDIPIDEPEVIDMAPGDIFALLSDGIYEYQNPAGEEYGWERVAEVIKNNQHETMDNLIQILREAVEEYADGVGQFDDMTMILVKRLAD